MISALACLSFAGISIVERPPIFGNNAFYGSNRKPLRAVPLTKLPTTAITPGGWLKKSLELQRDGLAGHLGEISVWLTKEDNAWLSKDGKGKYGWEEVPYWLRGYARIGYSLRDSKMLAETKFWIDGTLNSQRPNGDFGPVHNHSRGFRDLWAQMLMLQVLQSWCEETGDVRVIPFMTRYFRWQQSIPDGQFLKDYWENSRGGDNLASVYWVYNKTGEPFLLDLAKKIDRNTANWRQLGDLPNYHNVNIAECFREPATFYQQSSNPEDLAATYRNFDFIREKFGQVPGGMFGSDENCRPGHDDPHQAVETCGMVEQIGSNAALTAITGDPKWIANTEDVAYNSLPAAHMPDYKALRYLTAPNMVVSDANNHAPGLDNGGPFLLMNPFSSRCCQHNHTSGWVNFLESTWMVTQDNGLAALIFSDGLVKAKVGSGREVTIATTSRYPFEETVQMKVSTKGAVEFPLYVLIPTWAKNSKIQIGGRSITGVPGHYVRIQRKWENGDVLNLRLPMSPRVRIWDQMKSSVSVDFGPLTFSLKIDESYIQVDGRASAQSDSAWQPGADPKKWPTTEILPRSDWNFGLVANPKFKVNRKAWPSDGYPFSLAGCPLAMTTMAKQISTWRLDQNGLVAILPKSPVEVAKKAQEITLVPMGAARLRIASFPTVK